MPRRLSSTPTLSHPLSLLIITLVLLVLGWLFLRAATTYTSTTSAQHLRLAGKETSFRPTDPVEFTLDISTNRVERFFRRLGISQAQAADPAVNTYSSSGTTITAKLTDKNSSTPAADVTIIPQSDTIYTLKVAAESQLLPGEKQLEVSVDRQGESTIYRQNFTWGVLAINTDQATYLPGSTAQLSMAVLNSSGHMVCSADLTLKATDPQGRVTTLSTQDGSIVVNLAECQTYAVTSKPDFQTSLSLPIAGQYQLLLTAVTPDGTYSLNDSITVTASLPYTISRQGATRIFPYATPYTNTITFTPSETFTGTVTESLPAVFTLNTSALPANATSSAYIGYQTITWDLSLAAGQSAVLSYTYEAPGVSPMFYLLGPLLVSPPGSSPYLESRPWQIAADAVVVSDAFTETSNTDIISHTPGTGTGWTEVYDSYTTSNAYVLASTDVLKAAASVNSVGQAYTAQPAASGTDQDITITLINKPTTTGTRPAGIFGRYTDNNNFYHVQLLQNESTTNSVSLIKFASGVSTVLDSSDETLAANDVIKLEIRDATKKVYINSVEILSSTDNAITSGTGWGFYFGNFNGAGGGVYHMRAEWEFDNFLAEEPSSNSAPTAPTSLLAENATNPTGVTDTTPELSAVYNDPNTSDTALYYEIEVNTASDFSGTSMWDTGKTSMSALNQGSRSTDVSYAGTTLAELTTYYWRIRFWDNSDAEGAWSAAGNFSMANFNDAPTAPTSLLTEGSTNPTGVTDTTPEFSAVYNDPDTSDTAPYFEIEVNTASDFTGTSKWNTGKTSITAINQSARSPDISYAGTALSSSTTYYWRIRFWDAADAMGTWSSAANFTTGSFPTTQDINIEGLNFQGINID